jgi:hypothetical protein
MLTCRYAILQAVCKSQQHREDWLDKQLQLISTYQRKTADTDQAQQWIRNDNFSSYHCQRLAQLAGGRWSCTACGMYLAGAADGIGVCVHACSRRWKYVCDGTESNCVCCQRLLPAAGKEHVCASMASRTVAFDLTAVLGVAAAAKADQQRQLQFMNALRSSTIPVVVVLSGKQQLPCYIAPSSLGPAVGNGLFTSIPLGQGYTTRSCSSHGAADIDVSNAHGHCFPVGSVLMQYTGECLHGAEDIAARADQPDSAVPGAPSLAVITACDGRVLIDPRVQGGVAVLPNCHHQQPNMEAVECMRGDKVVVNLQLTKRVPAHAELFWDYGALSDVPADLKLRCSCGCRRPFFNHSLRGPELGSVPYADVGERTVGRAALREDAVGREGRAVVLPCTIDFCARYCLRVVQRRCS